jgi:ABC transporter substrate binding protein
VILVSTALILAPLQEQTSTIPIVFTHITDPVSSGVVASLARPGGNVTGFAPAEFSMYGKLLEALKEVAPNLTRVAVVMNPEQAPQAGMLHAIEAVAPALAVKTSSLSVRNPIERSFASFAQGQNGGLIVLPNPVADDRQLRRLLRARRERPRRRRSCNRRTKGANHWPWDEGVPATSNPTRSSIAGRRVAPSALRRNRSRVRPAQG